MDPLEEVIEDVFDGLASGQLAEAAVSVAVVRQEDGSIVADFGSGRFVIRVERLIGDDLYRWLDRDSTSLPLPTVAKCRSSLSARAWEQPTGLQRNEAADWVCRPPSLITLLPEMPALPPNNEPASKGSGLAGDVLGTAVELGFLGLFT